MTWEFYGTFPPFGSQVVVSCLYNCDKIYNKNILVFTTRRKKRKPVFRFQFSDQKQEMDRARGGQRQKGASSFRLGWQAGGDSLSVVRMTSPFSIPARVRNSQEVIYQIFTSKKYKIIVITQRNESRDPDYRILKRLESRLGERNLGSR